MVLGDGSLTPFEIDISDYASIGYYCVPFTDKAYMVDVRFDKDDTKIVNYSRRKIMKKTLFTICLVAMMVLSFTGCSKTGICEECGYQQKLTKYERNNGRTEYVCDACKNMMIMLGY